MVYNLGEFMKKIILFILFSVCVINAQTFTPPYTYTPHLHLGEWHQGDTAGSAAINNQWLIIDSTISQGRDTANVHLTRLNAMPTLAANNVFSGTNTFATIQTSAGTGQRVVIDATNSIRFYDALSNEVDLYNVSNSLYTNGVFHSQGVMITNNAGVGGISFKSLIGVTQCVIDTLGRLTYLNSTPAAGNTNKVLRSDGTSFTPDIDPYVYNLYNSYTQAGYSIGNSAPLPSVWQATASTAPGEIKLRLLYRHRTGNKNIRLQADIYGSVISANVAIGIGRDSLNSPIGVVYASTFSTSPSTQTVELPVSSFTPGNTYMIDISLRDANAVGTVYMTNVIVDVENY